MPAHRFLLNNRSFGVAVAAALLIAGVFPIFPRTKTLADDNRSAAARPVEMVARFTDDSSLRLKLQDEKIELRTSYGTLLIPPKDIKKIEMRTRIPTDVEAAVKQAIVDLGSAKHAVREAAMKKLLGYRENSYHALMEARHHSDPEIVQRANQILTQIRRTVPKDLLKYRKHDVIFTEDSKISGEILNPKLKVGTTQFGEQQLDLMHVHSFQLPGFKKPEPQNVLSDPGSMTQYAGQVGKSFYFRVTGNINGSLWGTDQYTTDSTVAKAAAHAGVVQVGQTGVVKVTIVTPPASFSGTARNGVTSSNWGAYPSAFEVSRAEEE